MRRRIVLIVLLGIFIGLTIWVTQMDSLRYMKPKTYRDIGRQTWNHIKMVGIAELLAIGVGVPLGILVTRPGLKRFATPVVGTANVGQTIPSLAVIAIMAPILGYGFNSAIIALFVYSLLPVLRNSYAGIKDIDPAIVESAKGMGMSRAQIAWRIELPLARPVIMAGIRTSTVICVGTATLA
ncbi:ABC transporter permease, partial [Candidatus Bipolaricaulota bacterium]|nr:ABC transporter permease [Candidatus Bipolaricaulota bacterium]